MSSLTEIDKENRVVGSHEAAGEMAEMRRFRQRAVRHGCRTVVYTRKFSKRKQRNGNILVFFSCAKRHIIFITSKLFNCYLIFKLHRNLSILLYCMQFYLLRFCFVINLIS